METTSELDELLVDNGLSRQTRPITAGPTPSYLLRPGVVLKLFPRGYEDRHEVETTVLSALRVDSLIHLARCPEIQEVGRVRGLRYLRLRMPFGYDTAKMWPEMTGEDKVMVARDFGLTLANLHGRRIAGLRPMGWAELIARRCTRNVPAAWSSQLKRFLHGAERVDPRQLVPLHTKFSFATAGVECGSGWRLSGVRDFECAVLGPREFDIAWTVLSVGRGKRKLVRALLDGARVDRRDPELPSRLLRMVLLRPDLDFTGWLDKFGAPRTVTPEALAQRWFPI